jgi:hypothetical protein
MTNNVAVLGGNVLEVSGAVCTYAPPPTTGYDGMLQINSSGLVTNGHGSQLLLIGGNFSGLDGQGASGFWNTNPWGSTSQASGAPQTGIGGPVFVEASHWQSPTSTLTAVIARITLNAASFLGVNQFLLDPAGTSSAPGWLKATATATTTNGTVLTVNSTTNWHTGIMITDLTGGSSIPAGTTVTVTNGTTLTCSGNVTVNSGDVLYATQLADPNGLFRPALLAAINFCRDNNVYLHLNCHINAPKLTIGGVTQWMCAFGQLQFIDDDTAQAYFISSSTSIIAWLATNFGTTAYNTANGFNGGAAGAYNRPGIGGSTGFGDIIIECFNEPYYANQQPQMVLKTLAGGTPASNEAVMLNGGYASFVTNNGANSNGLGIGIPIGYTVSTTSGALSAGFATGNANGCKMGSYQGILNGIRAMNATNIIVVSPDVYSSKISQASAFYAADSLSPPQVMIGYHCYQMAYSLAGVAITGTAGQFSCTANTIAVGDQVLIQGTLGGTGSIAGYTNPTTYTVSATNGTTTFTLQTPAGAAITTTVGTPSGLTYSAGRGYPNSGDPNPGTAAVLAYPQAVMQNTAGIGHVVPVIASEFGDYPPFLQSGVGSASNYVYLNNLHSFADTYGMHTEGWTLSGPAPSGYTGITKWTSCVMGTPTTLTGSISGTTLTVTAVTGTPLANGWMITSNGSSIGIGEYIVQQLSGITGGTGTYKLSAAPGTLGSDPTLTGAFVQPMAGLGQTRYNYSHGHA